KYRLQKFARKYRKALTTAAAFMALLMLAVVVSLGMAFRAWVAEDRAKEETETARKERDLAEAVDNFLERDLLELADPHLHAAFGPAPDKDITLRRILDRAAARIPGRFPDQPLVEAAVRRTIGKAYLGLGEYDLARPHLEAAFRTFQRELDPADLRT